MISANALPINLEALSDKLRGSASPGQPAGEGFLQALLQLQQGGQVSPQALAAFLQQHKLGKDGAELPPELAQFARLDEQPAQDEIVAGDPSALWAMLSLAGPAARDPAGPGQMPGELLNAKAGRNPATFLLNQIETQPNASDDSPSAFEGLMQTALSSAKSETAERPALVQMSVPTPVQHPNWGQAMGERLVWAARQDVQQARIELNPAHLGPLEININVKDDHTSIHISAQHALTRDTLETEMPRLRAMLGDAGFASVDVNVSQQDRQQANESRSGSAGAGALAADAEGEEAVEIAPVRVGLGLVDHYA